MTKRKMVAAEKTMPKKTIIGVDISKEYLDCFDSRAQSHERIAVAELAAWSRKLAKRKNILVVAEATGIYSRRFSHALSAENVAHAIVNPRQVRQFAQANGILAKNDAIDARVIANYARCCPTRQKSESYEAKEAVPLLRKLVVRRDQMLQLLQVEQGHLETCDDKDIRQDIQKNIDDFKTRIKTLTQQASALMQDDETAQILLSMPGIGVVSAAAILVHFPEIGSLNRRQVAAIAGLAPFVRDSGKFKGRRCIYGGRAPLRKALYMAALVAIRHNSYYKKRYQHLSQNGKPFKLAITAIMRQMIITLNYMVKSKTCWHENT